MFEHLVGNSHIKHCLKQMLNKNAIGNSLLFAGPEGIGKSLFADSFAKAIVAKQSELHPDIHHYRPEGKLGMHTIQSMRALSEEVYLPPYTAKKKVFIIHEAERMLSYSSNALLKTFEEPPLDTIIILLTSAPELLLPTIISRCRGLYFQPLTLEEISSLLIKDTAVTLERALAVARLAFGSAGEAFRIMEKGEHPLRSLVLTALAAGKFSTYHDLTLKAKEIAEVVGERSKEIEAHIKKEMLSEYQEKLTAIQREAIEKEIEGAVSLYQTSEVKIIFDLILSWFRDIHLLKLGGGAHLLMNGDWKVQAQKMLAQEIPSLENALEIIRDIKTSFARSTALRVCLETLFLKLNFL